MVGIKDIAHRASVSVSTVSYALNGSPKITDKTRNRILAIAKELYTQFSRSYIKKTKNWDSWSVCT